MRKTIRNLLFILICIGIIIGCDNSLQDIIDEDLATKYPSVLIKQDINELINGIGSFDFGEVQVGVTHEVEFVIENNGVGELDLSGATLISITGTDSTDFSVTRMPATKVDPGDTSGFAMQFSPSTEGEKTAQVLIVCNDPVNEAYTFAINGIGTATPLPEFGLTQNSVDISNGTTFEFGNSTVDVPKIVTFVIENTGPGNLELSGSPLIIFEGIDAAAFSAPQTPLSPILSSGSSTFTIQLLSSVVGSKSATVTIPNNDTDEGSYSFSITADVTATPEPEFGVTQNSVDIFDSDNFDFGSTTVDTPLSLSFSIENTGLGSLELSGSPMIDLSGTDAADFSAPSPPSSPISSGGTSTFTIQLLSSVVESKNATVTILNNDADEGSYSFTLTAEVTSALAPEINVRQEATALPDGTGFYPFAGTILADGDENTTTAYTTFTIENLGSADLTLSVAALSGTNPEDFDLDASGTLGTLAPFGEPASTTTFLVRFDPLTIGSRSATVTINNDDSDENPYTFELTGESEWWGTRTIDSIGDTGGYLSMDVVGNEVYISYAEETATGPSDYDLMFIKSTDGGVSWSTPVTVDSETDNAGKHSSITVEGSSVYISYYKDFGPEAATLGELWFAKSTDGGNTWPIKTMVDDFSYNTGIYTSLDVVGSNVYISYFDNDSGSTRNYSLVFAKSTDGGDTWPSGNIIIIDNPASGAAGLETSLAAEGTNVYISYFINDTNDTLAFAKSADSGDTWAISVVDPTVNISNDISTTSLVVDGNNGFICYIDAASIPYRVKFTKSTNLLDTTPTWLADIDIVNIDTATDATYYSSIAVDHTDTSKLYVSYYDFWINKELKFAKSTDSGNNWTPTASPIDTDGDVGRYNKIAVTGNNVFISYYDATNGDLKFMKSIDGGATW
jgi:hypothetical protein